MNASGRHNYIISLQQELLSQAARVRNLIDDAHWLSDGHHKEYLLISLLNRHLPSGMIASRGFVVCPDQPHIRSTEQDVMILDTTHESPIFNQGNIAITFPRSVRALVSVKSTMGQEEICDSVLGLTSAIAVCRPHLPLDRLFCGAYFFRPGFKTSSTAIDHFYKAVSKIPENLFPTGHESTSFSFADSTGLFLSAKVNMENMSSIHFQAFSLENAATGIFIASLLDHLAIQRGSRSSEILESVESAAEATQLSIPSSQLSDGQRP